MQSLEQFLKRSLFRLVNSFRPGIRYSPQQLPLESFNRILIIRQHDQLGDLMIATPAIRALRRKFPKAFIAVVVREYTAPVIEHNPYVDEVIVFYEKLGRWNIRKFVSFWKSVRNKFECVILLNTISRSLSSDLIALLSGAKYIVGPDHLKLDPSIPEKIYNVQVHRPQGQKHEIQRNLDIVRGLGADENDLEYDLVLTDAEVYEAERVYQILGIAPKAIVVGVHFGALNPSKCFPLDKLAAVIDWTIERYRAEAVLIVSPNEVDRKRIIESSLHHNVHSAPVMPLRIMAAFLRHLNLLMCNDTGTLHIAASQRVPTISFHSLSDPSIWKPPHPRHIAVRADDALITSITVEQVKEAVILAMNKYAGKSLV
ncbi:MAG TPA: glycosyltransferase family 9 protein [Bacteroidota bacterium]|nr:glycosyltransferase family 9 protein [Bacteroidota bacterium]